MGSTPADQYVDDIIARADREMAKAERWNRVARISFIISIAGWTLALICTVIGVLVA